MIFDLKYHIASLIAVFLALAIGILIGSTMVNGGVILEQQQEIINSLKADFAELRQTNKQLENEISVLNQESERNKIFQEKVVPIILKDKLQGKQVAIIKTNPDVLHQELQNTLEEAGAEVLSITTIEKNFPGVVKLQKEKLKDFNLPDINWSNDDIVVQEIARQLVVYTITNENSELINYLQQLEIIELNGEYGRNLDGVIFLGGSSNEVFDYFALLDSPMIDMFQKWGIITVGAETSSASVSYIPYYQKKNISTVDNIDTIFGRVSSVFALKGEKGHYGVKSSAERLLPQDLN